ILMMMNIQIVSKETIKPSIPRPHHLRNLKVSFLDQLAHPIYIPIVLVDCVGNDDTNVVEVNLLIAMIGLWIA
ncbi:hypothetical protein QQP08_011371, partial [Theobroma cacao]